jgi:hypothetical protein
VQQPTLIGWLQADVGKPGQMQHWPETVVAV